MMMELSVIFKIKSGVKGLSLTEVMVVLGIVGVITYAIMDLMIIALKSNNTSAFGQERVMFHEEIRQHLSVPQNCVATFAPLGSLNGPVSISSPTFAGIRDADGTIRFPVAVRDASGNVDLTATPQRGIGKLFIESLRIDAFGTDAYSTAILNVEYGSGFIQKQGGVVTNNNTLSSGYTAKNRGQINVRIQRDPSGVVTHCLSEAMMSDGIWRRSSTVLSAIHYSDGKVGIGTTQPPSPLSVLSDGSVSDLDNDISITDFTNTASIGPSFVGYRARGTQAAPQAVGVGDILSGLSAWGHNGSTFQIGASVLAYPTNTWTPGNENGELVFSTTSSGIHRRVASFNPAGELNFVNRAIIRPVRGTLTHGTLGFEYEVADAPVLTIGNSSANPPGSLRNVVALRFLNTITDWQMRLDQSNDFLICRDVVNSGGPFRCDLRVNHADGLITIRHNMNVNNNALIGNDLTVNRNATIANSLTVGSSLNVSGNATASMFTATSDVRTKTQIKDLSKGLNDILRLRPVTYQSLSSAPKSEPRIGLIAQEVLEVFPEVVREDEQGFLSLAYSELVAPLINAIRELVRRTDDDRARWMSENSRLRNEITLMQKELSNLNERLKQLEVAQQNSH
jgi:hypothetical protein